MDYFDTTRSHGPAPLPRRSWKLEAESGPRPDAGFARHGARSWPRTSGVRPMTTSEQPSVLEPGELAALRALARGEEFTVSAAVCDALVAKGMLGPDGRLTPGGEHAIHVDEPGVVPGLDN